MERADVGHIHRGILLSHEKGWNEAIGSNLDGPGGDHTKRSESERERERQIYIYHSYVESNFLKVM